MEDDFFLYKGNGQQPIDFTLSAAFLSALDGIIANVDQNPGTPLTRTFRFLSRIGAPAAIAIESANIIINNEDVSAARVTAIATNTAVSNVLAQRIANQLTVLGATRIIGVGVFGAAAAAATIVIGSFEEEIVAVFESIAGTLDTDVQLRSQFNNGTTLGGAYYVDGLPDSDGPGKAALEAAINLVQQSGKPFETNTNFPTREVFPTVQARQAVFVAPRGIPARTRTYEIYGGNTFNTVAAAFELSNEQFSQIDGASLDGEMYSNGDFVARLTNGSTFFVMRRPDRLRVPTRLPEISNKRNFSSSNTLGFRGDLILTAGSAPLTIDGTDRNRFNTYLLTVGGSGNDSISGTNFGGSGEFGRDYLIGFGGNDTINGNNGGDYIEGGSGNDTLQGGNGNDLIWGDDGADIISGGAQNDTLHGGAGNDSIDGGAGEDIIYASAGDTVDGGAGQDTVILEGTSLDYEIETRNNQFLFFNRESNSEASAITLENIETVEFSDPTSQNINLSNLESALIPIFIGEFKNAAVFRINLQAAGLSQIQSISIQDDNIISGGPGAISGFDLDTIKLSNTLINSASNVESLSGLSVFSFVNGPNGVVYEKGFRQSVDEGLAPILNQPNFFGSSGSGVNFGQATLSIIDNSSAPGSNQLSRGFVSTGEAGRISFSLSEPISTENLYLYFADAAASSGDRINVSVSIARNILPLEGLDLQGTDESDDINLLNQGVGGGNDNVDGGLGDDSISTGAGNDTINGGPGNDLLDGGGGADTLRGEDGQDTLRGGAGPDLLNGGSGPDRMVGGPGNDTFFGRGGDDIMKGLAGLDVMRGFAGNDRMGGGLGNDLLIGGPGRDELIGRRGNDSLRGGVGRDTLIGGSGSDRLLGGAGKDTFVLDRGRGRDIIRDFELDVDLIQVRGGIRFDGLSFNQTRNGVIVSFGEDELALFRGVSSDQLTEANFI